MIRWIPYTFVRTVLFFVAGILLGYYSPDIIPQPVSIIFLLALTCAYFFVVFSARRLRDVLNPGWIGLPLIFLFGYCHLLWKTESRDAKHLLHNPTRVSHYKAIITRYPEEKARSWKLEARVTEIHTTNWEDKGGRIVLYFPKEDFPHAFRYGDVLLVRGQPQVPDGPSNPGEFDYRKYLALRNIHHQHFVRKGDVMKIDHLPLSIFMDIAFRGRDWAASTLNEFVPGSREQAIASALVLGVTDGLDNELFSAFSATGTMHILAVSGLHVSIIYFILRWIFSPLNRFRRGRWTIAFVSLAILWLYAFVTGLSPSVLRAVAMFSFLAIATPWARSTNVYNTLAVSAFCLLLFDPFLVFSVGFQLSYLAVLGIVYIYPRILRLWEPQHGLTIEVWKISAVSISAQVATFPLGLLYFHQFPNYFLLSNLLVVPLSFVVLILGLLLLSVSFLSMAAIGLGICLQWVVRFLNGIVFTLEDFPFSMIENIFITSGQCALIMLFIIFVLALFEFRKFHYVTLAFSAVLAFTGLQWLHFFQDVNIQKVTVYKVPGHSAVDLIDRGRTFFLTDDELRTDAQKMRYHVVPNRLITGAKEMNSKPYTVTFRGASLMLWNGKRILQLRDDDFQLPPQLTVDWIIIGNNSVPDIERIATGVTCKKVILDSSNSFFFSGCFLEEAKLYKLDVHSVLHQGAFVSKIQNRDT